MENMQKDLEERIKELEHSILFNQNETEKIETDYMVSDIVRIENFIDKESLIEIQTTVQLRLSGNPQTGTTAWPDNRGYCQYYGSAWLQNEVGDKLNWYYIESCAEKDRGIKYPDGKPNARGYNEVRNTHSALMGWVGRWFGGRCRGVGCWARFLDESGYGYRIHWHFGA